jgi:hypothetical protein
MEKKNMNTINNGKIRFIVFRQKESEFYTGVCLDFGIVVEGESADYVKYELEKGASGYLKTVKKDKLSDVLLNNQAPKEYWELYDKILKQELDEKKPNIKFDQYCNFNINFIPVNHLINHASCYA